MVNNHLSSFSFELHKHVASHYKKNSIKVTTFGILCSYVTSYSSCNFLKKVNLNQSTPGVKTVVAKN